MPSSVVSARHLEIDNDAIGEHPTNALSIEVIEPLGQDSDSVEVRLPVVDERQPLVQGARGVKAAGVKSKSDNQSSFTNQASSLPSTSVQLDFNDDISASLLDDIETQSTSVGLNRQETTSKESDRRVYKNNLSSRKPSSNLRTSLKDPLPRILRFRVRGDSHNQDIAAARLRFRQEKAARQQDEQRGRGDYQTSGAGHSASQANAKIGPTTLRQSKPSVVPASPTPNNKPVVKLPRRDPMSYNNMKPVGRPTSVHGQSSPHYRSNAELLRSLHRPANGSSYPILAAYNHYTPSQAEWETWQEISIKISDLPPSATTRDLWRCFNEQGTITMIEFYENQKGQREGKATVRFRYVNCWYCSFFQRLIARKVRHQRTHFGKWSNTQFQSLPKARLPHDYIWSLANDPSSK